MRCPFAIAVLCVVSSSASGADTAASKHAVPSQQAQAAAVQLAREVFAKSLDDAATLDEKREVTRRIFAAAAQVQDTAERYVLLRAARNIAAQAGDVESAMRAVDELDRSFHINRRAMLIASLSDAAKAARLSDDQKHQIATKLLDVVDDVIQGGDIPAAVALLSRALDVSRTSRDPAARKRIATRAKAQHALLTKYQRLPDALKTLQANPADPEANLLVGKFHALVRGDWQHAMALLERSSSPEYRAIAVQETLEPIDANSQVQIGDGWWSLAQQGDAADRAQLLGRATHWYRTALPKLPPGLTRMKVADRLQNHPAANPVHNSVVDAARKLAEELAAIGKKAAQEQRAAADQARRDAEKLQQRERRQQIAEFRRRELEQNNALRHELAIREIEARAEVAKSRYKALEKAWKYVGRRSYYYPVRSYYAYPRTNYFYGLSYPFYRLPLLNFYYPTYRLHSGHGHHFVTHHRGHHGGNHHGHHGKHH